MRVLFWSDAFWPAVGGIPVIAAGLLRSLAERGHSLHVVAEQLPGSPVSWALDIETTITRCPFLEVLRSGGAERMIRLTKQISELKRDVRPDLVLVFTLSPSVVFHQLTRRSWPSPSIVTLHGSLPFRADRRQTLVGRVLEDADWVMACSESCLRQAIQLYPSVAGKSSVALNALAAPPSAPRCLDFNPPRILFVGRLSHEKGADLAISAMSTVLETSPRACLQLVGDGPERQRLQALVERNELGDRVTFHGSLSPDQVRALMSQSSIVVVPSRSEGFSLVALEAAQMGRATVAARVGGLPEVVIDGQTGFLVPPDRPEAIAAAILDLIENPARAGVMAAEARRRAEDTFSWTEYVDAYDDRIRTMGARGG